MTTRKSKVKNWDSVNLAKDILIAQLLDDGVFTVDDEGRVWRHKVWKKREWLHITPKRAEHKPCRGYLRINQYFGYSVHTFLAHRLVCISKYGLIPRHKQINHINGNKADNHPSNLEIVSAHKNGQHASLVLKVKLPTGEKVHNAKLTTVKVDSILDLKKQGKTYKEIANCVGSTESAVTAVCIGQSWNWYTKIKDEDSRREHNYYQKRARQEKRGLVCENE